MSRVVLDVEISPSGAVAGSRVVKRSLEDIAHSSRKMESTVGGAVSQLKRLLVGLGAAFSLNQVVQNTIRQEQALARLEAAILSTGGVAERSAADLSRFAAKMQSVTTYGDEAVMEMQALLLTFKDIKGDMFDDATKSVLDLSAAIGQSLQGSAIMVGKALNDPIQGLLAMKRVGIQFSDAQEEIIKKMVQMGDKAGAQKVILQELSSQFGGMSTQLRSTLGGALDSAKNAFGDLLEMNHLSSAEKLRISIEGVTRSLQTDAVRSFADSIGELLAQMGEGLAKIITYVNELTLAVKVGAATWLTYKAALWSAAFPAFLATMTAWLSLAPLAVKSFSEMATWLSLIGVSAGAAFASVGVGIALFMELKDQMKRSAEKAKLLSDAMVTVNDKFAFANKSTLSLLEAEIDKTTTRVAELKEELQEATKEALKLSTARFVAKNGVMGGAVGESTEAFRKDVLKEIALSAEAAEALLTAQEKRRDEIKKSLGLTSGQGGVANSGSGLDSGSSESAVSRLVSNMRDQMKYLNIDGETFLGTLDKWMAKLKPLSDDWKKIADVRMEILGDKAEAEAERIAKAAEKVKEAQNAAAQGIDKFWSEMRWSHQEGFTSGDDLLKSLQEDFERMKETLSKESNGLIDTGDPLNWTDGMKARFSEIQSLASELASSQFASLNQQLENGVLTQKEWTSEVEKLKAKYGELPKVVSNLNQAQEDTKNTASGVADMTKLWANDLARGLADAVVNARDLGDALRNVLKSIASSALQKLIGGWLGFADGGVFSNGNVIPFARGGVVTAPTLFPMARGMGLMGEAGPEAVMPLKRGADGKLGVEGGGGITNVTVHINAIEPQTFAQAMRSNRDVVESVVVENIMRDGIVRRAIKGC